MRLAILLVPFFFLSGAQAQQEPPTEKIRVTWPDNSRDTIGIWACTMDDGELYCLDFKEFLKYVNEQEAEAGEPSHFGPQTDPKEYEL